MSSFYEWEYVHLPLGHKKGGRPLFTTSSQVNVLLLRLLNDEKVLFIIFILIRRKS